jgi:hypothetical protein
MVLFLGNDDLQVIQGAVIPVYRRPDLAGRGVLESGIRGQGFPVMCAVSINTIVVDAASFLRDTAPLQPFDIDIKANSGEDR